MTKPIVLTEEEREALRRSAKYLKERGEYLSNGKMKSDAITLENLLARSGGEEGNEQRHFNHSQYNIEQKQINTREPS